MPLLKSWVETANDPAGNFPLNNLPYGAFAASANESVMGCCVAIGDQILDLSGLEEAGLLTATDGRDLFLFPDLNDFMGSGPEMWAAVRAELQAMLAEGATLDGIAADAEGRDIQPQPVSGQQEKLENIVSRYV